MFVEILKNIFMGTRKEKTEESKNVTKQVDDSADAITTITECLEGLEDGESFNLEAFNNADGEITVHFTVQK